MNLAINDADLKPEEINYINAHGTSTTLNDEYETLAIKRVFGEYAYKVPISSIKSMTGHLMGASGAIELITCVLTILNNKIPPTINYEYSDPKCDLYYVPNKSINKTVNVALSNSMGFGGHNACIVLKKYEDKENKTK